MSLSDDFCTGCGRHIDCCVCHMADNNNPDEAAAGSMAEQKDRLLYSMARLIRNTDDLKCTAWGVKGSDLLTELRTLDEDRYKTEVY